LWSPTDVVVYVFEWGPNNFEQRVGRPIGDVVYPAYLHVGIVLCDPRDDEFTS